MWALESRRATGGNLWGVDQVWGLQELHLLFKLMELPVNGVRSGTTSGATAAVHFWKAKGVPGNGSWVLLWDWSWFLETGRISCERAKKKKNPKQITLIYVTPGSAGQLILSVRLRPGVPFLPTPPSLLLQVHRSSRQYCTVAAMSTCLSASITVDNAALGGKQDPGHKRVSKIAAWSCWLVRPQTRARPTTLIVASAANGHLINTSAPGALMTYRSKCVKDQINNGRE